MTLEELIKELENLSSMKAMDDTHCCEWLGAINSSGYPVIWWLGY